MNKCMRCAAGRSEGERPVAVCEESLTFVGIGGAGRFVNKSPSGCILCSMCAADYRAVADIWRPLGGVPAYIREHRRIGSPVPRVRTYYHDRA